MDDKNQNSGNDSQGGGIKTALVKYALIVAIIVGAFAVVGGTGLFLYAAFGEDGGTVFGFAKETPKPGSVVPEQSGAAEPEGAAAPKRTTALVMGVNQGLADTMFLLTYESGGGRTDIVSVPRDTQITLPKEDVTALHALGRLATPNSGVMKINELHSYAGAEYGPVYVRDFLENMLDVHIDYYAVISLSAFRNIVDLVGGIEIEVPSGGMIYNDPLQNLEINLSPGLQTLDGKHAEQFVRFRDTYSGGDLDRIKVQQSFMRAFFEQALSKENIRENWLGFASTLVSYVKTDITLDDIPQYLPALASLDPSSLNIHQIPGEAFKSNGVWYFAYDHAVGPQMIDEIFYSDSSAPQAQ
jgi:LCP family protein required for cell wall assembly